MADKPAGNGFGGRTLKGSLSTREGAIALALAAAVIAGLLLFVFVKRYKDNVERDNASRSVFVARALIPKGTTASTIATQRLLQRISVKPKDVVQGAIVDPAAINGQVALGDIAPGSQIVTPAFGVAGEGIPAALTGKQRAIAIPVDATHDVDGQVHPGDYVDIFINLGGSLRGLFSNVYIMGGSATAGGNGNLILRAASSGQAARMAFAADNGKLWLALRPVIGSQGGANTPSINAANLFQGQG